MSPQRAIRIADRTSEVRDQRRRHPDLAPRDIVLYTDSGNWGIRYRDGSGATQARRRHDRRPHRRRRRGLAGDPGRLGDGPRSRRLLRREVRELVHLAPALRAVPVPVLRPPPAVPDSAPRPAGAGRRLRPLALLLQPGRDRDVGAARLPGARLLPRTPAGRRPSGPAARPGRWSRSCPRPSWSRGSFCSAGSGSGSTSRAAGWATSDTAARSAPTGSSTTSRSTWTPAENDQHFDTYGPVNYLAYDPFVRILKPTEQQLNASEDYELPAARVAALVFDVLTIIGLFLLGLRLRSGRAGRMLGLALAYGWVSFPYTLFPLMTNGNDTLIAMFLVYALLALTSTPARGALIALAGAAKFAPLALAPLFATGRGDGSRLRSWISFGMMFAFVMLIAVVPYIPADGGLECHLRPDDRLPARSRVAVQPLGPELGSRAAALGREGRRWSASPSRWRSCPAGATPSRSPRSGPRC